MTETLTIVDLSKMSKTQEQLLDFLEKECSHLSMDDDGDRVEMVKMFTKFINNKYQVKTR